MDAETYAGIRLAIVIYPKKRSSLVADDHCACLCLLWGSWVVPVSQEECYLVDPASSHMLVSKIKPCMCKYELIQTVKLRMAH